MPKHLDTSSRFNGEDLTGISFTRWTVIGFAGYGIYKGQKHAVWSCKCTCGVTRGVFGESFKAKIESVLWMSAKGTSEH